MKFITKYFKLDSLPSVVKDNVLEVAKKNEVNQDSIEYTRKGLETYKQPDFVPGEKAIITYISTGALDRDKDIILPSGVDLTDYNKHPIVMWAHKYSDGLPLGRCAWIKSDAAGHGLIAKTVYANHPVADLVYNYRKDGFPLAVSIGFLPTRYISRHDVTKRDEFNLEIKNALDRGWINKDNMDSVNNIIQKWSLVEFSDTPCPSNPQALQIACSKGLISKEEYDEDMKTIIQIDGLKDMPKVEEKIEVVKIEENNKTIIVKDVVENKVEVKTITPPVELITKEIVPIIEQKKADKKGNPSVSDIRDAIYVNMKKMREDIDKMHMEKSVSRQYYDEAQSSISYMGIEDLYPIEYPNGHVVCCYSSDHTSPQHFYDYKYKYDAEAKTAEMGKMTEMEVGYNSKGICKTEIENLAKVQLLKSDFSKIEIEQLKNIENIELITSSNLVNDNGNSICLFSVAGKLYKTEMDRTYTKGAEYVGSKNLQVDEHFSKFISTEAKSMEEWVQIKYDLQDFYLKSAPGKEEMLKFCKEHNLQHKDYLEKIDSEDEIIEKGVEETENEIRIRVQDPNLFEQNSFRYKIIKATKPVVKAVFGKKKGSSTMELQAYRFPKADGWTKQSAKAWVKEHGKKSFDYVEDGAYELPEETIVSILQTNNKNMVNTLEEMLGKILGKAQI